jgi:hypothetical protein
MPFVNFANLGNQYCSNLHQGLAPTHFMFIWKNQPIARLDGKINQGKNQHLLSNLSVVRKNSCKGI